MLGLVCLTPSEYCGLAPVHTPSDMVGKNFRSAGSAEHDTMAALGANPVDTEVPPFVYWDTKTNSLQKTPDLVVPFDGIFLSWAYMNVTGANTWATDFTQADLQYRMFILAMNKEK